MNNKIFLSRDSNGSGLYSLWAGVRPILKCGFWQSDTDYKTGEESLLMVTVHYTKAPWYFTLQKGECQEVRLIRVTVTENAGKENQ